MLLPMNLAASELFIAFSKDDINIRRFTVS